MKHIVIGLDGRKASWTALRWAANQAELCGARLRVVHVWELPATELAAVDEGLRAVSSADARARATRWLAEALPDREVTRQTLVVLEGPPGPVLVEESRDASLLVVGTRERVGLRRLLAGSVSHYCLSHAACPVVAVPAADVAAATAVPAEAISPGPLF